MTHWSRDRRTLHLTLHVHDHSSAVVEVDEDDLLPVPGIPLTDHHHGRHLLPEHRLALLHETHDVKPRHCDLVQAASDAHHGNDGKVLVAHVVRTIHDAHTDAHLELGFVLVLACSWLLFFPAVGPLFPAVVALFYPLWVHSFHLSEVLVGAAVNSSLFSTVRTCVRSLASPLASAELTPVQCEASVTSKTWLSTC